MTRKEHLQYCNRCTNRKFDAQKGIICSLTNRIADFEGTCPHFTVDESVKVEPTEPAEAKTSNHEVIKSLGDDIKVKLRDQQDTVYAMVGGVAAALLGAAIWAAVTVATNYQIGYMAIGVGALVGFAVRYYGCGVDQHFGFIGAALAIFGCMLGNLFSQVYFYADSEALNFFQVLFSLNFSLIVDVIVESFSGMDIFFYAIAAYEGYRFAFRQIDEETINSVSQGKMPEVPMARFRIPTVILLFLLLPTVYFLAAKSGDGETTSYYESGAMAARGELVDGVEHGPWQGYHENGQVSYEGSFNHGKLDGIWTYYDENGARLRDVTYKNNLEHGTYKEYYPGGAVASTGSFENGRQKGLWLFYYENGNMMRRGTFQLDRPHGEWEEYYEDGKQSFKGTYEMGTPNGKWTQWDEEGRLTSEFLHDGEGRSTVINVFYDGKQEVVEGNGTYTVRYADGTIGEAGMVKDGKRTGPWKRYSPEGEVKETGRYKEDTYYVVDVWNDDGEKVVSQGEGMYVGSSVEAPSFTWSGKISGGLREGQWILANTTGTTVQEMNYVHGKLDGLSTNYFESGQIYSQGNVKNDEQEGEWTWYHETGEVESKATFVKGKKEGVQYIYNISGDITRTERYEQGKLVEVDTDY